MIDMNKTDMQIYSIREIWLASVSFLGKMNQNMTISKQEAFSLRI